MNPQMRKIALLVCCLFFGCSQKDSDIAELKTKLDSLESKLAALSEKQSAVEMKVFDHDTALSGSPRSTVGRLGQRLDALEEVIQTEVALTPSGNGYRYVQTSTGVVTVQMDNIRPYANGSKVRLSFMNLSSATISSLTADMEWGPTGKHLAQTNNSEITVSDLIPGKVTSAEFSLGDVPPDRLKFVHLSKVRVKGLYFRE
jgi:hypothetical protein